MSTDFEWGKVRGQIEIPADVQAEARRSGEEHHQEVENMLGGNPMLKHLNEFNIGHLPLRWFERIGREYWFPDDEVGALGFDLDFEADPQLLMTTGIRDRTEFFGPTYLLVLANGGLEFCQGAQQHRPKPGEWFIFNFALPHEVRGDETSTSLVVLSQSLLLSR